MARSILKVPFVPFSRCRLQHQLGNVLALKAQGQEDMPKAVKRNGLEELPREIDREGRGIGLELLDQRVAIEHGDGTDQIFDVLHFQHGGERSFLTRTRRSPRAGTGSRNRAR